MSDLLKIQGLFLVEGDNRPECEMGTLWEAGKEKVGSRMPKVVIKRGEKREILQHCVKLCTRKNTKEGVGTVSERKF